MLIPALVQAQSAVVVSDSAYVKEFMYPNAKTIAVYPKGTLVTIEGKLGREWTRIENGFIISTDLVVVTNTASQANITQDSKLSEYTIELLTKDPRQLTATEISYLMLQEQKNNEALREDIRSIAKTQRFIAVLSAASILTSLLLLAGN